MMSTKSLLQMAIGSGQKALQLNKYYLSEQLAAALERHLV